MSCKSQILSSAGKRLNEDDRELGWVLGEWKVHNSQKHVAHENNSLIKWEEILELVSFKNQTRIVKELWRRDFKQYWLNYLVPHSWKRKGFLSLVEASEKFCRRWIQSRQENQESLKLCHRYSNLKPCAQKFLFPTSPLNRQREDSSLNETGFESTRKRKSRCKIFKVTVALKGWKSSKYEALVHRSYKWRNQILDQQKSHYNIDKPHLPVTFPLTEKHLTLSPSQRNLLECKIPSKCILSEELKELAFLLEYANSFSLSPWKHIESNMSKALSIFLQREADWAKFCKKSKIREKNDRRCKVQREAFEKFRDFLRRKITSPKDKQMKIDLSKVTKKKNEHAIHQQIKPLSTDAAAESLLNKNQQQEATNHSAGKDGCLNFEDDKLQKELTPKIGQKDKKVKELSSERKDRKMNNILYKDASTIGNLIFKEASSVQDGYNKDKNSSEMPRNSHDKCSIVYNYFKEKDLLTKDQEADPVEENEIIGYMTAGAENSRDHYNFMETREEDEKTASEKVNEGGDFHLKELRNQLHQKKEDLLHQDTNQMERTVFAEASNELEISSTPKEINRARLAFHEIPAHVLGDTDDSVLDFASDLTTNEDDSASKQLDSLQAAKLYVSELRSYQLFSSSMRREAQLLLHISQWRTWHMTSHSNTQVFSKTQETIINAFRDDEILLSKQAFRRASLHIPKTNQSLIKLANDYANIREMMWVWWCGLVQGCCVEFATQFPRVWNDFEYTQRSLWEYITHLESGLREHHFDQCLRETAANSEDTSNGSNFLKQSAVTTKFLPGADAGQYVKNYVSSLKNYLEISTSVRNKVFFGSYFDSWKCWEKRGRINKDAFLELEEARLDKFRIDEMALLAKKFRSPHLQEFEDSIIRPLFSREIELYLTIREKLWILFCCEILWPSWKVAVKNEDSLDKFRKSQERLWDFFRQMESAIMKTHGSRCTQLSRADWPPKNPASPFAIF